MQTSTCRVLAVLAAAAHVGSAGAEPAAQSSTHGTANAHMQAMDFDALVARFEAPDRARWQKPELVIGALGDIKGKTVMDLGAGTGYFSFRLAAAGAHVIAADVDPRFQQYIEQRLAKEKPASPGTLTTRHLAYDSPGLAKGEADQVLMVDVYHHIEQRVDYLRQLREGLKPEGELVIVDFKKSPTPEGPPIGMRLEPAQVERELASAGFKAITTDTALLPYQYLVKARP